MFNEQVLINKIKTSFKRSILYKKYADGILTLCIS